MAKRNSFTRDEIVLCIYAARYDAAEIGGIDSIHSLRRRSRSSIRMKIQNIVAMCDDEGISRDPAQNALTGLPAGETGRRTNWDIFSHYVNVPRASHLLECRNVVAVAHSWPGELHDSGTYREGSKRRVLVNAYERDPIARQACIDHYGPTCVICDFNFLDVFGSDADGFIHVHHLTPLAEIGAEYAVDPIADLRPVCPNCHAVIHLGNENRTIEEVRGMRSETPISNQ